MVVAALFFTVLSSLIRYVDHLPTFQLVFFRCLGSLLCCVLILLQMKRNVWGNRPKWLVYRSLVGLASMILFFRAIQLMPLGSAVTLRYLSPFFAAILAMILLKEKMRPLQWIFFAGAFLGVLMVKGWDPRITPGGLVIIIASALLSGLVYVIIRKIGKSEHPIVIIFYFMLFGTVLGGLISMFYWKNPQGWEWLALLGMGLVGFSAQYFMTRAIQSVEARLITPFKYVEVITTVWAGWFFFGEYQTTLAIIGIGIIIICLVLNLWAGKVKGAKVRG